MKTITYRSTGKPDQPELEWNDGKMYYSGTMEEVSWDQLVRQGYFERVEEKPSETPVELKNLTSLKCWCGNPAERNFDGDEVQERCLDSVYHDPFSDGRPKRVSRLYVAGPMSGYPGNNYDAFHEAARILEAAGYEVVNPAAFGADGGHYVDLIRKDLELMLPCHGVATLENWWESVGARNEVNVAGVLKMPVRPVVDWLERAALELKREGEHLADHTSL